MGTYVSLAADEAAVSKILKSLIQDALDDMDDLAHRALLKSGGHINRAYLQRLRTSLRNLAEEKGIEIVNGKYSDRLAAVMEKAIETVVASVGTTVTLGEISTQLLDLALSNSEVLVQDILDDGVKIVNEEVAASIVTGKSHADVAAAIKERLVLGDGAEISSARADKIARSEVGSVYRQAQYQTGKEFGFKCYKYVGPSDDRTEPICQRYLDKVLTEDEWREIYAQETGNEDNAFRYDLHYGGRHQLVPVPCPEGKG